MTQEQTQTNTTDKVSVEEIVAAVLELGSRYSGLSEYGKELAARIVKYGVKQ